VHDPPVPAAGKPPVVEGAEYEVHGEDREGEVEAFFGFFDNECEEERAGGIWWVCVVCVWLGVRKGGCGG